MEPPPVLSFAASSAIDQQNTRVTIEAYSSSDDEGPVELTEDLEGAKAQHEMFVAGAVNGGVARLVVSKYPVGSSIVKLKSPFEIKRWWMYNEWDPVCQFSGGVQRTISDRSKLDPDSQNNNAALIQLIEETFRYVRGRFVLWQEVKEHARWKKVVVEKLELQWVLDNVEILYPVDDKFPLSALNGIVLWKRAKGSAKRFEAIEGNHRLSSWRGLKEPATLPAILFIGKA